MNDAFKEITYSQLSDSYKELLSEAEQALKQSYSPYSKFRVGAALLTLDGKIITGTNIENASYGATLCAERSALARANVMGYRSFSAVAITTSTAAGPNENIVSPCGMCRQMLFEAFQLGEEKPLVIILANTLKTRLIQTTISDLFPLGFGPRDLD